MRLLLTALLLGGCLPRETVILPTFDAKTNALILLAQQGGSIRAYALDPRSSVPLATSADTTLTLLLYERTLTELQLIEGPLDRATGEESRPLPQAVAAISATLPQLAWQDGDLVDHERFRLPGMSPARCAAAEGCYRDATAAEERLCNLGCDVVGPAAPEETQLPGPISVACPAGWSPEAIDLDDPDPLVTGCIPAEPGDCPGATAHFLGDAACAPIGGDCPADGIPPDQPGGVFVSSGAAPGGDGSRGSPFRTIAEAVSAGGSTILIAAGNHAVAGRIDGQVRIVGACTSDTELTGSFEIGGDLSLRDLTLRSAALSVEAGGRAVLDRVLVLDGPLAAEGGTLTARRTVIRDVRTSPVVLRDADSTLEDVVIEDCATGIDAVGPGIVDGTRLAIRRTDGPGIKGVSATIVAAGLEIREATSAAVDGTDASIILTDAYASSTQEGPAAESFGLRSTSSSVTLSAARFDDHSSDGVRIAGGSADITDLIIRNERTPTGGGLWLEGANTTVDGLAIFDARTGLTVRTAADATPVVDAKRVIVRRLTSVAPDGAQLEGGVGIALEGPGAPAVSIEGVLIEGTEVGVSAEGESDLDLIQVTIRNLRPPPEGRKQLGIRASDSSDLEARKVDVEGARNDCIEINGAAVGILEDLTLTGCGDAGLRGGRSTMVMRAAFTRCGVGITVNGPESIISAQDIRIDGNGMTGSVGVDTSDSADFSLNRFYLSAAETGLALLTPPYTFRDGEVVGCTVGASLPPSLGFESVLTQVRYRDNDVEFLPR